MSSKRFEHNRAFCWHGRLDLETKQDLLGTTTYWPVQWTTLDLRRSLIRKRTSDSYSALLFFAFGILNIYARLQNCVSFYTNQAAAAAAASGTPRW
jgi:hypothetical protein